MTLFTLLAFTIFRQFNSLLLPSFSQFLTSFTSALVAVMPPVHSKGYRSDYSDTPRGFRTEKGKTPRHQAKGGKSDYTDTPRGKGKREQEKERRDSVIEDAYQKRCQGTGGVQESARDFQEALCLVLR